MENAYHELVLIGGYSEVNEVADHGTVWPKTRGMIGGGEMEWTMLVFSCDNRKIHTAEAILVVVG
jgi:hypothetical protein